MLQHLQFPADLVIFTEEILNGKWKTLFFVQCAFLFPAINLQSKVADLFCIFK